MSENGTGSTKVCAGCGTDVTSKPRVKDAEGAYFCRACASKKQAELAKKLKRAPGAAVASQGAMALESDPEMMARLVEDSVAKAATACPACRRPWKQDASICTFCGFNKMTGQMVGTQIQAPQVVSAPKASGGAKRVRGGKKFAGAHWKVALVLVILFGAGFGVSMSSPEFGSVFMMGVSVYMFLFGVFAAIDAYQETDSILKAICVFICGLYALIYCVLETGNDLLKGTAWAYIIVWLLVVIGSLTGNLATEFGGGGLGGNAPLAPDGG